MLAAIASSRGQEIECRWIESVFGKSQEENNADEAEEFLKSFRDNFYRKGENA